MLNKSTGLLLFFLIVLSACIPTKNIEDLAIVTARGVDITDDNQIETTLNIIRFDPQADSIYTNNTGIGYTIKGAREEAADRTSYNLVEGQINIELYGKEAAEQGILRFINGLIHDAQVSDTMKLVVSNVSAKEIMNYENPNMPSVGTHLSNLIEIEVKVNSFPSATIQDFSRIISTIGQDPLLPLVGFQHEKLGLIGMAVFQDDRYVSDISLDEGFLINLFHHKVENKPTEVQLPIKPFEKFKIKSIGMESLPIEGKEFYINSLVTHGKSNTKVESLEKLKFKTDTYIEINLSEVSQPIAINNEKAVNLLEKEVGKELKKQYEELLKKVQEANADIFGFGKLYRTKTKDGKLTEEEWREKFPEITVDFNVDVKLMHTGTIQ